MGETLRHVIPGHMQCSMACGGRACKYENPSRWSDEEQAIKGLYSSWYVSLSFHHISFSPQLSCTFPLCAVQSTRVIDVHISSYMKSQYICPGFWSVFNLTCVTVQLFFLF